MSRQLFLLSVVSCCVARLRVITRNGFWLKTLCADHKRSVHIYSMYPPLGKSRSRAPIKNQPTSRDLLLKLRSLSVFLRCSGSGLFLRQYQVSPFRTQSTSQPEAQTQFCLVAPAAGRSRVPNDITFRTLWVWKGHLLSAQEISQERSNPNLLQGTYFSNCVPWVLFCFLVFFLQQSQVSSSKPNLLHTLTYFMLGPTLFEGRVQ